MANKLKLRKQKYPPPYEESEKSNMESYTENKERDPLIEVSEDVKDEPANHSKVAKFIFAHGDVRFEEDDAGNIICGGCKRSFKRIIGHLSNSVECAQTVNLSELKSEWQKFTKKKKNC